MLGFKSFRSAAIILFCFYELFFENIMDSHAHVLYVRLAPRFGNACYYHDFDSIVYQLFIYKQYAITGIENIHIIQKRQITGANNNFFTFENFVMLMAIMSKI